MTSQEIFEKAAAHGISEYELGKAVYGEKRLRNIYRLQVPTDRQLEELKKVDKILNKMIKKGNKNGKTQTR